MNALLLELVLHKSRVSLVVCLDFVSLGKIKTDKLVSQLLRVHRKQILALVFLLLLRLLLLSIRICFENHRLHHHFAVLAVVVRFVLGLVDRKHVSPSTVQTLLIIWCGEKRARKYICQVWLLHLGINSR